MGEDNTKPPQKIAQKFLVLQLEYSWRIEKRLQEIEKSWRSYRDHFDQEKLETLVNEVHRLAGSAPTYGFELLGKLAAEAEDSLEKLQNSQSNVTEVEAVILQLVAYKSIAPEK